MKRDKLVPGIVLVVIGAAILLANFGYLEFHWDNFERLWPIFIVIIGINLVLSYNKTPWASILRITVVIVGIGLLLFGNFDNDYYYSSNSHRHVINSNNDNDGNDDDGAVGFPVKGTFNEPYAADIKVARLNISGGAVGYHLSDTTNQLFSANTSDGAGKYDFSSSVDDSVHVMDFNMNNHFHWHLGSNKNRVEFKLNPKPVWEINLETGMSGVDFDLSKFKVRNLQLHGGMAGYHVKLGAPEALTNIEVSTGMAGVDIYIPRDAACSVETDSGLSGNDFDDVPKTSDDHYQTAGYDAAKTKFHIHISGGFSGFHVKRY
jgi:hypothetical protein